MSATIRVHLAQEIGDTTAVAIREQRLILGHSQQQVTDGVNCLGLTWHQTTLSKIESGRRSLLFAEAVALCIVLNMDVRSLAEGIA